jgi:predicted  nucleic acid-binding Zn-ribbon protein
MGFGGPNFVITLIAICTAGWVINNWIRARHGYALEDEWGGKTQKNNADADHKILLLSNENEALNGKISHLEERIAVLERIVTDKAGRLSDEIEALRSPSN